MPSLKRVFFAGMITLFMLFNLQSNARLYAEPSMAIYAALTGGQKAITYTVLSTDTLTTIATALTSAINADTRLQAIGVTATAKNTVVSLQSTSPNLTTYVQSVSAGATETISLSTGVGVTEAAYNNVNDPVSRRKVNRDLPRMGRASIMCSVNDLRANDNACNIKRLFLIISREP